MGRKRKSPRGSGKAAQKITAFSAKGFSVGDYRARLRVLKGKFGANFSFPVNAPLTGPRKAAISRAVKRYTEFLNPENSFRFVPVAPAKLKAVRKAGSVALAQATKKGVFVPVPPKQPGAKRTRVSITKDGQIKTRTGKFTSHHRLYPSAEIAANPEQLLPDAKELGAETLFITIKGHRGLSSKTGYSPKNFVRRLKLTPEGGGSGVIPDIIAMQQEEGDDDDEIQKGLRAIGMARKRKGAFRNFVGVEFVTYDWETEGKKLKGKKKHGNKGKK